MAGSDYLKKKTRLSMNINQDFNEIIQESHSSAIFSSPMAHGYG